MFSAKRIFLFFTVLFSGIFLSLVTFIQPVHAQTYSNQYSSYIAPDTNPDVPKNLHTLTQSIMLDILSFATCAMTGSDPLAQSHKCLGWDSSTGRIGYVDNGKGLIGFMTNTVAQTFNIPVHAGYYSQYVASSFHLIGEKSYAATNPQEIGIGAQGLDPILSIWVGFRNIAYLLIVIVFLILGVLIMLRFKIDPRTVMTIQNQIPKIIIGLLVITFSFAIAGFFIDMMYVVTFLFLSTINSAVGGASLLPEHVVQLREPITAANSIFAPDGIFGAITSTSKTLLDAVNPIVLQIPVINLIQGITVVLTWLIAAIFDILGHIPLVGQFVPGQGNINLFDGDAGTTGGGIVGILIYIALTVSIFTALFRFWLALITAYITILFNIVLGPIRILLGLLPSGPGGGLGAWFKELIANLAVFPVSISFMMLAAAIAKAAGAGNGFTPYMVPGAAIGGVVSFAAMLMLPKIPDAVKEAFKVKDGGLGAALTQSAGVGAAAAALGLKTFGKKAFQRNLPVQGQAEGFIRRLALGPATGGGIRGWARRVVTKGLRETDGGS